MNLHDTAMQVLQLRDPADKVRATADTAARWRAGELTLGSPHAAEPLPVPGRPDKPELVAPRALAQRGLGTPAGRAAFLHAVAHIEFNAINLGWDAVYRFRDMPRGFYDDWVSVADDEARHFTLLQARLREFGHDYGDFPAHNGLWDMACLTTDDCLTRMALVPRVLEARGLDVTPAMIDKLRHHGDHASVAALQIILDEEIGHVAAGSRWYLWCCQQRGLDPASTFRRLLAQHAPNALRPPFNIDARRQAGFDEAEVDWLLGYALPERAAGH